MSHITFNGFYNTWQVQHLQQPTVRSCLIDLNCSQTYRYDDFAFHLSLTICTDLLNTSTGLTSEASGAWQNTHEYDTRQYGQSVCHDSYGSQSEIRLVQFLTSSMNSVLTPIKIIIITNVPVILHTIMKFSGKFTTSTMKDDHVSSCSDLCTFLCVQWS